MANGPIKNFPASIDLWVGNEETGINGLFIYHRKRLIAGLDNTKEMNQYAELFARAPGMQLVLEEVLAYLNGDQLRPSDSEVLKARIKDALKPLEFPKYRS